MLESSAQRCPGRNHHDPAQADEPSGRTCPEQQRANRSRARRSRSGPGEATWLPPSPVGFRERALAHRGRRLVPDARQPAGRIALSGGHPCAGVRADPVEMDHDRPGAPGLAALDPEALAHAQRAGRRSAGQAAGRCRGLPVGRWAGADHDQEPTRTAGSRWGAFARGRCFSLRAREGFRFFGRLVKPGEGEITVELTRIERAARRGRCGCFPSRFR